MASRALLDDDEIFRLLKLFDSENKSDLLVYLQKEAYTSYSIRTVRSN